MLARQIRDYGGFGFVQITYVTLAPIRPDHPQKATLHQNSDSLNIGLRILRIPKANKVINPDRCPPLYTTIPTANEQKLISSSQYFGE